MFGRKKKTGKSSVSNPSGSQRPLDDLVDIKQPVPPTPQTDTLLRPLEPRIMLDAALTDSIIDAQGAFETTDFVNRAQELAQVAATGNAELLLHLAVGDAITFTPGSRVVMFLNVSPLRPLEATVRYTSFEATPTPEGALAYSVRAALVDDVQALPRIGLKGTARIHGEQVSLFYYLFRKPISALRRTLGL